MPPAGCPSAACWRAGGPARRSHRPGRGQTAPRRRFRCCPDRPVSWPPGCVAVAGHRRRRLRAGTRRLVSIDIARPSCTAARATARARGRRGGTSQRSRVTACPRVRHVNRQPRRPGTASQRGRVVLRGQGPACPSSSSRAIARRLAGRRSADTRQQARARLATCARPGPRARSGTHPADGQGAEVSGAVTTASVVVSRHEPAVGAASAVVIHTQLRSACHRCGTVPDCPPQGRLNAPPAARRPTDPPAAAPPKRPSRRVTAQPARRLWSPWRGGHRLAPSGREPARQAPWSRSRPLARPRRRDGELAPEPQPAQQPSAGSMPLPWSSPDLRGRSYAGMSCRSGCSASASEPGSP